MPTELVNFVEPFFQFIQGLSVWEWMMYFWPFLFIDLVRYTIMDGLVFTWFGYKRKDGREQKKRKQARQQLFAERPLVSVLVPGKDEGAHLPSLIQSLERQTYKKLEVVVVDDGSIDQTPEICRRLQKQGRIDRFIRQERRGGKASAANTGLRWCQGKFVVHIDADSHLREDAIENILLPFYQNPQTGAVGGDLRVANTSASLATRLQAIEYLKAITLGRTASAQLGILRIVAGAFGAFRRSTLEQLKGWDVGPGLDGDLTLKIRKLGLDIAHEPEAVCYTNVPTSFKALAQQRYRWSRSMVRFRMRKHKDLLNPRQPFRMTDFFASAENIFFNLALNFKWWVYGFQVLMFHLSVLPFLFVMNWILYVGANTTQFSMAQAVFGEELEISSWKLLFFLPLMPFYMGLYIRVVRTFAYVMEFFHKSSYQDAWNPWKVSRKVQEWHR